MWKYAVYILRAQIYNFHLHSKNEVNEQYATGHAAWDNTVSDNAMCSVWPSTASVMYEQSKFNVFNASFLNHYLIRLSGLYQLKT